MNKLDVSGNKLKNLPHSIIQLSNLQYVNIERNKFIILNSYQKKFLKKRDEEVYWISITSISKIRTELAGTLPTEFFP